MKKILLGFVLVSLSMIVISCGSNAKKESNTEKGELTEEKDYKPGEEWKLVWADEFDGDSLNMDNWNYQVEEAGRFNDEWQRYTNSTENAYVEDGNLVLKAIHESDTHGMDQYTSARLNTAGKQAWKYGKIAARIKLPYGIGLWPAFWMLGVNIDENGGDTPWPMCGEVDILELYGSRNDSVIEANIHYADSNGNHASMGAKGYELEDERFADDFHIFEFDWDAEKVSWYVDGEEFASMAINEEYLAEFHEEFFLLFNVAVGNQWAGRPDERSVFPQFMYVDWVRVYQK